MDSDDHGQLNALGNVLGHYNVELALSRMIYLCALEISRNLLKLTEIKSSLKLAVYVDGVLLYVLIIAGGIEYNVSSFL